MSTESEEIYVSEGDEHDLWPRVKWEERALHAAAFPDPDEPHVLIVRYVGKNELDARAFALEKGGTYVYSTETTTTEREPWEIVP